MRKRLEAVSELFDDSILAKQTKEKSSETASKSFRSGHLFHAADPQPSRKLPAPD